MRITVLAHPRSKFEKVIEHEGVYNCYFNVAPERGKANEKVTEMLSDYFKKPKSKIKMIFGKTSRQKLFEIE